MAGRVLTRANQGWGPAALRIAGVYLAARAVTTGFFLLAGALAGFDTRFGPDASLGDHVRGWDAQWYWLIAVSGYPSTLPTTEGGAVGENAWAFMPVYAWLSDAVGRPFGSWAAGAFLVSIIAGYLCCLVLHALMRPRIGGAAAMWSVGFFACAPLAALFQVGYAEALFLLWILLGLWALVQRRYTWLYLLLPLMAYTRPGVLAFALLIALHGIVRLFRLRQERLRRAEVVHILALGAFGSVLGFSWPVIVGVVTGDPDGYLATELAWRRSWVGDEEGFIPFTGWVHGAQFWVEDIAGFASGWGVAVAIGIAVVLAVILLCEPHVRRLDVEVRLWSASYLLYLFAVFFPQSSLFRLLFPLSPLWGAFAQPRSPWWRGGVLALCLLGQWWWIWNMYGLGNNFWQIP